MLRWKWTQPCWHFKFLQCFLRHASSFDYFHLAVKPYRFETCTRGAFERPYFTLPSTLDVICLLIISGLMNFWSDHENFGHFSWWFDYDPFLEPLVLGARYKILKDLKREGNSFCFTLVPKGIKKSVIARKNCLFRLAAGACKHLAEAEGRAEDRPRGRKGIKR